MKKVISTRMDSNELAKARDGLMMQEIDPAQINTVSQILRLTFYYGLMAICPNPKASPSEESIAFINQKIGQNKTTALTSLNDIINKN